MILSALLAAATPVAAQPVPGEGFDVLAYDVALEPEIAALSVQGRQNIRFTVLRDGLRHLAFSPNALTISDATLNGHRVEVAGTEAGIVFTADAPLPVGEEAVLSFTFAGTPRRGLTAFPGGFYTSYFACDWMVCLQDSPGDKASLSLSFTLPSLMSSLGPGQRTGGTILASGATVQGWRTTGDISPYLYAFAVGQMRHESTRQAGVEIAYIDATGGDAPLPTIFAQTPALIAFLSDKAGMDLPGGSFTQLLVPGYEAQEAAGFSLIGADVLAGDLESPDRQWVLVHELAHQWWGNSVTCATWRDFWLNEGMATFMTAAWKQHRFGEEAYQAELDVAHRRIAAARERGFDMPLAWDGKYPSLGLRRAVQYSKGALFIDHLRQMMGDDAFWAGIRAYTRANAGGSVTSADFQRSMQQATAIDLTGAFDRWVYTGTSD